MGFGRGRGLGLFVFGCAVNGLGHTVPPFGVFVPDAPECYTTQVVMLSQVNAVDCCTVVDEPNDVGHTATGIFVVGFFVCGIPRKGAILVLIHGF